MRRVLEWSGITLGAVGLLLMVPRDAFKASINFLESHDGLAGWFQAVASVAAIVYSAHYALKVPREARRSARLDQEQSAVVSAVAVLGGMAGLLVALIESLQVRNVSLQAVKALRLELLQKLELIPMISPDALPRNAVGLVVSAQALVRNCTLELLKLERGEIEARELNLEAMKHAAEVLGEALAVLEARANELGRMPRSIAANHAEAWKTRALALQRRERVT